MYTIIIRKSLTESLKSRINHGNERNSDWKVGHLKLFTQEQKRKNEKQWGKPLEILGHDEKKNNLYYGILKGEDKVTVIKFKAIMSENFPNMERRTYSGSKDPKDSQ